jgi:hypothetical protein
MLLRNIDEPGAEVMQFQVANMATFAIKDVLLNPNLVKVRACAFGYMCCIGVYTCVCAFCYICCIAVYVRMDTCVCVLLHVLYCSVYNVCVHVNTWQWTLPPCFNFDLAKARACDPRFIVL